MDKNSTTSQTEPAIESARQKMLQAAEQLSEDQLQLLEEKYPKAVHEVRLQRLQDRKLPLARHHAELAALAAARIKREAGQ